MISYYQHILPAGIPGQHRIFIMHLKICLAVPVAKFPGSTVMYDKHTNIYITFKQLLNVIIIIALNKSCLNDCEEDVRVHVVKVQVMVCLKTVYYKKVYLFQVSQILAFVAAVSAE